MQSTTRIVAKHGPTGLYFSKTAGLTADLFATMTFADEENARNIVERGFFKPADPENYMYVKLVTTKEVH